MTEPDDARCSACGAAASSRYCPHCGARTGWTDLLPPGRSRPAVAPTPDAPATVGVPPATVGVPATTVSVPATTVGVPPATVGVPATPDGATTVQVPPAAVQFPRAAVDADAPTLPDLPAVVRRMPPQAVPEMFSTEFLPVAGPARAWSQTPDSSAAPASPPPGLFPGWTGMHPAVPTAGADGVLAPRPERRRKAMFAVLGIAAATVIVLLAALLIAPSWRGTGGTAGAVADKVGPGPVASNSPVSTLTTAATASNANAIPSGAGGAPPVGTVTVTAATGPGRTAAPTSRSTAGPTVKPTAASTPKPTAASTPKPTAASTPKPTAASTPKPTAKSKPTAKPTPKPSTTAPVLPLGVPKRDIVCTAGYIVQLASELDEPRFKARVAALKSAGRVPAGALAADSTRSCRIFTSQVNTLVLYSGPFASKYDGCAARLAGPADAYIKGGNADSSGEYVSCLCPAAVAALPRYSTVGQQGVWVGELQRVLGNRLNIGVTDLAGNWGRFTAGTQSAVRAFQQAAKLPGNGVVDARTWSALQSAEC